MAKTEGNGGAAKKEAYPGRLGERVKAELVGITLLGLTVFMLFALASFTATDPSFNSSGAGAAKNMAGLAGSYVADALYQALGFAAYLIPVATGIFAVRFMIWRPIRHPGWVIAGYATMTLSAAGLVNLYAGDSKFDTNFVLPAGGALGALIQSVTVAFLNRPGAFLFILVSLLCASMFTINFSLFDFGGRLKNLFDRKLAAMREGWEARREEKEREKSHKTALKAENAARRNPHPKIIAEEEAPKPKPPLQESFEFVREVDGYVLPPTDLFERSDQTKKGPDEESLIMSSKLLLKKLQDFGVNGTVETVRPGPVVTMFEFKPADGVKINKIVNLGDDLALALRALSIRIVAPIPGKDTVGVEIPNAERDMVTLGDVLDSNEYRGSESKLTLALGKDISGNPVAADLAKMPHLLIAGATGSGKSVAVHSMLASLLARATPKDVRLLIVDPKMLELSVYDGIPHLLLPVVTESKKAAVALKWAVSEMERRYRMMADEKVRNLASYNKKVEKLLSEPRPKPPPPPEGAEGEAPEPPPEPEHLPHIVVIIDELADLMMVAAKDVEESIARLAQMARAAGIHLIVATQRPSVDVITGMIKANFPARIAFQVASRVDSRTILDCMGAESLLGGGDMLFMPPGTAKLTRIHGSYVSEGEIAELVKFLRKQGHPDYNEAILESARGEGDLDMDGDFDEFYDQAVQFVAENRQASVSMIQRRFKIGYNRAARIIELMEQEGVVGPSRGAKPREVLVRKA